MNINLEKIAKALKEYEDKNGVISVRSHQNVNYCTECFAYANECTGKCRSTCYYTCRGGYKSKY